jgi:hypothetical protein
MSALFTDLSAIAFNILGHKYPYTKDIQNFSYYINEQSKTVQDFEKYIYSSDTYKDTIKKHFKNCIHVNLEEHEFNNLFGKFKTDKQVTIQSILDYIFTNDVVIYKYKTLISSLFEYELNTVPSDANIDFYLNLLGQATYNFDNLSADIVALKHTIVKNETLQESNEEDILTYPDEAYKNIVKKTVEYGTSKNIDIKFDNNIIEAFEAVFQRPMYIQEYFKYQGEVDWVKLHSTHTHNFNTLREIFQAYTGKSISEYYYVSKYLYRIDEPNFFELIIDEIVDSPEYNHGITEVISNKYMAMYDIPISNSDKIFIFNIIQKQKLGINSETIGPLLTKLKQDTDTIVSKIFKVFKKVLERAPDINEIDQYIDFYRKDENAFDVSVEKILMHTLEFHDNIKNMVKTIYKTKFEKDILPSILFEVLNKIIVKLDDLTMDTVVSTITLIIENM